MSQEILGYIKPTLIDLNIKAVAIDEISPSPHLCQNQNFKMETISLQINAGYFDGSLRWSRYFE